MKNIFEADEIPASPTPAAPLPAPVTPKVDTDQAIVDVKTNIKKAFSDYTAAFNRLMTKMSSSLSQLTGVQTSQANAIANLASDLEELRKDNDKHIVTVSKLRESLVIVKKSLLEMLDIVATQTAVAASDIGSDIHTKARGLAEEVESLLKDAKKVHDGLKGAKDKIESYEDVMSHTARYKDVYSNIFDEFDSMSSENDKLRNNLADLVTRFNDLRADHKALLKSAKAQTKIDDPHFRSASDTPSDTPQNAHTQHRGFDLQEHLERARKKQKIKPNSTGWY